MFWSIVGAILAALIIWNVFWSAVVFLADWLGW
jgi:hypothetical protein